VTFLSLLLTVLKAVGIALGLYKQRMDGSIGAAVQAGQSTQDAEKDEAIAQAAHDSVIGKFNSRAQNLPEPNAAFTRRED
jgi:hypothetical protein